MVFRINETGEIKELFIIDPNTMLDWSAELILESGALSYLTYDEDDGEIFGISFEYFKWWETYIDDCLKDREAVDKFLREIHRKYEYEKACKIEDEFWEEHHNKNDYDDYETHHNVYVGLLEDFTEKYL